LKRALKLWDAAVPIVGTPVVQYLADVRKIDVSALPPDVDLRFHESCPFGPGEFYPCMLALVRDVITNQPVAIHRTALTSEVMAGAASPERRLLGRPGNGAIKLWPLDSSSRLVVGEGIETVLAAAIHIPHRTPLRPAWSMISAGRLEDLPVTPGVSELVILVDHDEAGRKAAAGCTSRWRRAGRQVVRLQPTRAGTDFNDTIREG
jgi:hypothetical protein